MSRIAAIHTIIQAHLEDSYADAAKLDLPRRKGQLELNGEDHDNTQSSLRIATLGRDSNGSYKRGNKPSKGGPYRAYTRETLNQLGGPAAPKVLENDGYAMQSKGGPYDARVDFIARSKSWNDEFFLRDTSPQI